ncbi:MAG TPA: VIT domain-containing protein [Tepidisphaeraceae bacterium]|jgi:Ca-activated chloride channel family protein
MNAAEPARIALRTNNESDRIALRGVRLTARVAGMSLKATVEQTFVNLEPTAIEAVYTFPLPEGAAVCAFEVVFFDRVFTGVIEEAERAIEKYDDAISQGHAAYLLEQHRPDVFSVRVGNLKPRQAVTIRLSYVADLETVDRSIRLAFPTTIAPRYTTASGTDPLDAAVDGDALNPPHVLSVPYGLSMELEIDLGKGLTAIESPSHAIQAMRQAAALWKVTFAGGFAEMDRDVVLNLKLAREQEPFALAATSPQGERFVALNFLPEFEEIDLAGHSHAETIFVLDCSGSMQGESIAQAQGALECCLRSMSIGDRFNLCRFGSRFYLFQPRPVEYSERTLRQAIQFLQPGADLGGTELMAPLEEILAEPPAGGGVRNIVLLTDGQVTNEPAVIALARRKRAHNRIFTFGIGHGCSAFLIKGLARVSGGAAEFIAPGERIEEKVLRTFGRLASPPVSQVEIDWGDADAEIAPRVLPPLFDGDALRVFARLPGRVPETVTLRCVTAAGPRSWTVRVQSSDDPANVLPSLWARAMIRTLEEEDGVQPTISISAPSRERSRLVEISRRYNLLCSLTSFIAVEHRSLEDRNEGRPALRRVPIQLQAGWGGNLLGECVPGGAAGLLGAGAPAFGLSPGIPKLDRTLNKTVTRGRVTLGNALAKRSRRNFIGDRIPPSPAATPAPAARPPADDLVQLLAHQSADGAFDTSASVDQLIRSCGPDRAAIIAAIDKLLHDAHVPPAVRPRIRQTLLVLVMLRLSFAGRQGVWVRASKKAVRFIADAAQLHVGQADAWVTELVGRFHRPATAPVGDSPPRVP